jgi:hypothetical protein
VILKPQLLPHSWRQVSKQTQQNSLHEDTTSLSRQPLRYEIGDPRQRSRLSQTLKKTWHPRSRPEVTVRDRPAFTCGIDVSRRHCSTRRRTVAPAWSVKFSRAAVPAWRCVGRVCVPEESDHNWTLPCAVLAECTWERSAMLRLD